MTKADILNDIDYIKTIAEEGRTAPLIGGRIGIMWGFLLVITLLVHWSALKGIGPIPIKMIGGAWMVFGITGSIGASILGRSLSGKPGATSTNNRVARALWTGTSILLFTYGLSAGISAGLGRIGFEIMDTMMPLAFGLYALTTFVISKISADKSQLVPSIIALAFVPISLFLLGTPELYLAAIVAVICTIILPGIFHMRNEPKTLV